jgi:hypothetical protein
MKFQALSTFTVPMPDQMHVFNAGAKGELPDEIMAQYVDAGLAKPLKGRAAKAEPEPDVADDDAPVSEGEDDAVIAASDPADADAPPV